MTVRAVPPENAALPKVAHLCNYSLPNQELSVLYGGPTLNYGGQLSLYVVNMTRDLAHLQLSDLQDETRPITEEKMLICQTQWSFSLLK